MTSTDSRSRVRRSRTGMPIHSIIWVVCIPRPRAVRPPERRSRVASPVAISPGAIPEAERRGRAILFESVAGSTMPVVANVVGGRRLLALGLGVPPRAHVPTFLERSRERVPPVVAGDAPVHEVVRTGADVDLRRLPLVVHSEKDAGPYVTAGLAVAKDPETGIRNVSFNRMMLRGPDEVGIRMMPPQHLGQLYEKAGASGRSLPVAVAIGNHPAELVA